MYAWIQQIPNSKIVYPDWMRRREIMDVGDLAKAAAQYIPIRPRTMCPALMLAASRTLNVIGRTRTLIVSMMISAGASQAGAPLGRKLAEAVFGFLRNPERIRANQSGSASVTENRRCDEALRV